MTHLSNKPALLFVVSCGKAVPLSADREAGIVGRKKDTVIRLRSINHLVLLGRATWAHILRSHHWGNKRQQEY